MSDSQNKYNAAKIIDAMAVNRTTTETLGFQRKLNARWFRSNIVQVLSMLRHRRL